MGIARGRGVFQIDDVQLVAAGERRAAEMAELRILSDDGFVEKADAKAVGNQFADDLEAADADGGAEHFSGIAKL